MRRFDVWIGRLAAVAGLVYLTLRGTWPFDATAADERVVARPSRTPRAG